MRVLIALVDIAQRTSRLSFQPIRAPIGGLDVLQVKANFYLSQQLSIALQLALENPGMEVLTSISKRIRHPLKL